MNIQNHSKPSSLQGRIDSMLQTVSARKLQSPQSGTPSVETMKKQNINSESIASAKDNTLEMQAPSQSRRDQFLNQLPPAEQVEIMRWAESHDIRPNDPLWLLVDFLGYTKFMTGTLPSQMRAAGQVTIDAIAMQRRAEADAFSANAQKALGDMLASITNQVVQATGEITDAKLRKRLWIHGLSVSAGILILAALCVVFGFVFAHAHISWIETPSDNAFYHMLQSIFGLPVGYLVLPIVLSGCVIFLTQEFLRWRSERAKWHPHTHQHDYWR
ncbi:MAG: hypothetical protein ACXWJF_10660 [Burkholderiaceae bacterium]